MITYTSIRKGLRDDNKAKVAQLEKSKPVFPILTKYAKKFSEHESIYNKEKRYAYVSYQWYWTFSKPKLILGPAENEGPEEALKIVDEMIRDKNLEMTRPLSKEIDRDTGKLRAGFHLRESEVDFDVEIDLTRSLECRRVGTGKYNEVMEYRCF